MVSNRYKGFVCCAKQNNEHRNSYLVSNTYKRLDKYFLCVFFHFPPFSHVCEIPIHEVQKWEYGIDQRASKHNVSIIWELARKSFGPHPKPKDSLRSLCPIECDSQIPNATPSIPTSWNSHSCVVLPWVFCLPSNHFQEEITAHSMGPSLSWQLSSLALGKAVRGTLGHLAASWRGPWGNKQSSCPAKWVSLLEVAHPGTLQMSQDCKWQSLRSLRHSPNTVPYS